MGKLFIVSGPSGAGKSTLTRRAIDFFSDLRFSISYTTRPPRPGEQDGVDYRFVDDATFDRMVEQDEFVEYATVHGRKYGTGEKDLKDLLASGVDVLLDIDVQGAEKIAKRIEGGVFIFVLPPSIEACRRRLEGRGDIAPEELEKRVAVALEEIKKIYHYDYVIINDNMEEAFEKLKSVIIAERTKKDVLIEEVRRIFNLQEV